MSINEEELIKIKKATSGWFKGRARRAIAQSLVALRLEIERAKMLPDQEQDSLLKQLMNQATSERHRVLQNGATSYSHPDWAAAAVCESWLHELVGGTPAGLVRVEALIDELLKRV